VGAPTPSATWTPSASSSGGTAPSSTSGYELSGASRIKWGALLGIFGLVLAVGGILIVLFDVGLGVTSVTASSYVSLLRTILLAVVLVLVGVFVAFLSFIVYTAGFASLRKADRRFRTPMVLCVIGILGLALIGGFVIFYAAAINSAIACPSTNSTCQNAATSISHVEVVLGYIGGFLGFIGLIGTILGLYRFGARYSSSIAKVGAILYIIPFLSVLAPILVFVGAYQVQKRLSQPAMVAPGIPPFAPPPPPP
jgi:hypothetical protein